MALRGIVKLSNVPVEIDTYVRITDARLSKRIIRTDPVTGAALPSPKKAYLLFLSVDWHVVENDAPVNVPYRHEQHQIVASEVPVNTAENLDADAQILTVAYELLKTLEPYKFLISDNTP
jgi:hypothetical protein